MVPYYCFRRGLTITLLVLYHRGMECTENKVRYNGTIPLSRESWYREAPSTLESRSIILYSFDLLLVVLIGKH